MVPTYEQMGDWLEEIAQEFPDAFFEELDGGIQLAREEKPDPEFYKILRELSAIGNRINQLAAKANALDYIDTPMLQEEVARWRQFQTDVRKAYLLPKQVSG